MEDCLWRAFRERLDAALLPYQGQVAFGNLRKEISAWGEGARRTSNVAIIYETPGGSTNQVNVTYHHRQGEFVILDPVSHLECEIRNLDALFRVLDHYMDEIPAKRLEILQAYIRAWREQGLTRQQALQSLRQFLLPMDLKGGTITEQELSRAARYTVRLYAGRS